MKEFNIAHIPETIQKFILDSWEQGFRLCLVGGLVRDWLLGIKSNDFDFEIRHLDDYEGDAWIDFLKTSFNKAEYIGVGVFRIKFDDVEIEFSSPRTESFTGESGHKNFIPKFSSKLTYLESFKRRDLRINAIGLEFNVVNGKLEAKLVDPFSGVVDIENKEISYINDDFFKDPVRLLRAIRFSINTGFTLETTNSYSSFDLSQMSAHYFRYESKKCKNQLAFVEGLVDLVNTYNIELPYQIKSLIMMQKKYLINSPISLDEVLLSDLGIEDEQVYTFFAVKKNKVQKSLALKNAYKNLILNETLETKKMFLEELARQDNDDRLIYYNVYSQLSEALKNTRSKEDKALIIEQFATSFSAKNA